MSKQKKKLVCVGWGIWDIVNKCLWCAEGGDRDIWARRKYTIERWDFEYGEDSYRWCQKHGEIIAKKLWVEVD